MTKSRLQDRPLFATGECEAACANPLSVWLRRGKRRRGQVNNDGVVGTSRQTGSRRTDKQPGKGVIRSAVNKTSVDLAGGLSTWLPPFPFLLLSPFSCLWFTDEGTPGICKLLSLPFWRHVINPHSQSTNSGQWFQRLQTARSGFTAACRNRGCPALQPSSSQASPEPHLEPDRLDSSDFLFSWAGGTHLAVWMAPPRVGLNGYGGGWQRSGGGGKGGVRE